MISQLTQQSFVVSDRVLHVAASQKPDIQRVVAAAGLKAEWFTGASAIREYSDTGEPDFSSPSSWILAMHTPEDANTLQAALDLE